MKLRIKSVVQNLKTIINQKLYRVYYKDILKFYKKNFQNLKMMKIFLMFKMKNNSCKLYFK